MADAKKVTVKKPTTVELALQLTDVSNWIEEAEQQMPCLVDRQRKVGLAGDSPHTYGLNAFNYSLTEEVQTKLYKNFVRTMKAELKRCKEVQADLVKQLSK